MKLLIINELVCGGGAEYQVAQEKRIFEKMGDEVYLLTFDPSIAANVNYGEKTFNIPFEPSYFSKLSHRLLISGFCKKIRNIVHRVNPDLIHIHNALRLPLDIFKSVEGYNVVQTLHDYGSICPLETCVLPDQNECAGYVNHKCSQCVGLNFKRLIKICCFIRKRQFQNKYVKYYFSPSKSLTVASKSNGFNTACINNPIDFNSFSFNKHTDRISFLYYGLVSQPKGVLQLIRAFELFNQEYPKTKLTIVGELGPGVSKNDLNKSFINYLGRQPIEKIKEILTNTYCVIVPSLLIENYPNTALEAISSKTLVIGSNRGGIPEIIMNKQQLFDVRNANSIVSTLEYAMKLSEEEYSDITEESYSRLIQNNNSDLFYRQIKDYYKQIKGDEK